MAKERVGGKWKRKAEAPAKYKSDKRGGGTYDVELVVRMIGGKKYYGLKSVSSNKLVSSVANKWTNPKTAIAWAERKNFNVINKTSNI